MWIVVMTNYLPGWKVTIDQQLADLTYIGNYLAVEAVPGKHVYVFDYKPASFQLGFGLTIATTLILIGLMIRDLAPQQYQDRFQRIEESAKIFLRNNIIQPIRSLFRPKKEE
jgi:hypothetical protein